MKRTTFFTILFALVTITGWAQNNFTISGDFSVIEKAFYTPTKVVSVHIYNDSTVHLPLGKRQEKCVVKDGKFKISGNVSRPIYSNLVAELELEIDGEKRQSSTEIPFILEPGNIVLGTEWALFGGTPLNDASVAMCTKLGELSKAGETDKLKLEASWCIPCRREIPNLIAAYNKYKDKGLQVLGIAAWDEPDETKKAIKEDKIPYPQIINSQKIAADTYGIAAIPRIILFAPDGTILANGLRGEEIENKLEEIFRDK